METKKDSSSNQTLSDVCGELFSLVVYLREAGDIEDPNALYDRAIELFASMEKRGRELKIAEVDVRDAKYALIAIIDETVGWSSRLEQQFLSSNVAGEEFFNRIEEIKDAKVRNEALGIYYLCLTLGFEGRYFRSPERIQEYIANLGEILNVKKAGKLSPRAERSQATIKRRSGISAWMLWAATGVGAVILMGVVILLRVSLGSWARDAITGIQSLLG